MKKIEAIVRASKFEDVKEALGKKEINFFTFYEVKGYGHQAGKHLTYRGAAYDIGYIGRVKIELLISEPYVGAAIEAISDAAKTGEKGDGLITVTNIENIINIRTALSGSEAINS